MKKIVNTLFLLMVFTIFNEGKIARNLGLSELDNPYPCIKDRVKWWRGYYDTP